MSTSDFYGQILQEESGYSGAIGYQANQAIASSHTIIARAGAAPFEIGASVIDLQSGASLGRIVGFESIEGRRYIRLSLQREAAYLT